MTVKTRHSTWEQNPLFDHENINEQENNPCTQERIYHQAYQV
jgi:hypothetical protein